MRVLLVEDEAAAAKSVAAMLRCLGHDYDITDHGEAAVRLAISSTYDIILLDVMLPDIDGYEVMHRLRAANVRTPVLIQSGLVDRNKKALALGFGVEDILIKPFDRAELGARMDRALSRVDSGGDARPGPSNGEDTPAPPSEHRAHKRSKVIKSAQIVYQNANCVMDCTVMDMSQGGAALKPADPFQCPKNFDLRLKSGPTHPCETCWQYGGKVGVRFLDV
ncbi:MAG: response regulator [Kiloniellaceae bacterium]